MKVELLKKDENSITLLIHDIFPEFTNTIRRYSFMVKGLAIDEIVVYENSSQIWDEYIAHRLGQIPLKYSPEDTNCDVITGSIKKEGPPPSLRQASQNPAPSLDLCL
jgi:DNA-directed RNA polymerase alpha subunit